MTPDRYHTCLDAIGWTPFSLATRLGVHETRTRRWGTGRYEIPPACRNGWNDWQRPTRKRLFQKAGMLPHPQADGVGNATSFAAACDPCATS